MDFRLAEGGSGLVAAQKIRERSDMPVIFCTAHAGEPQLAEQMKSLKRSVLIGKPASTTEHRVVLSRATDS